MFELKFSCFNIYGFHSLNAYSIKPIVTLSRYETGELGMTAGYFWWYNP